MARASRDFEQFRMNGEAGGGFVSTPFNDGAAASAAASVLSKLGDRLGRMADKAAVRDATKAGQAAGDAAMDLPTTEVVTTTEKAPDLPQDTLQWPAKKTPPQVTEPNREPPEKPAKAAVASKGRAGNKAALARGYFEKLGYAPHQAAGIVGNLMQESALNTGAVGDRSIPGASVGIGQWNRERQSNLKAFAANRGRSWTDFETQLAFVHHELQGSESGAGARLKQARNVDEATAAMIGYERPLGWTPNNPRGGHGWNNRLKYAQQVLGGNAVVPPGHVPAGAGARPSGVIPSGPPIPSGMAHIPAGPLPDVVSTSIRYTVPAPKPLALRNDGTLAGDAYDAAAKESFGWKLTAGLDAEMTNAAQEHKDDPAAFASAMRGIGERYMEEAGKVDPDVKRAIAQRALNNSSAFIRESNARAEQKAEEQRKANAMASLDAENDLIERQAYALGAATDSDEQLGQMAQSALGRIDKAATSGAITPMEAAKQRERIMGTLTVSRIKGVYDALETPDEKLRFAQGLMNEWAQKDSPLSAIPLASMQGLVDGLEGEARELARTRVATNAYDKARIERLVEDDIASTGKGVTAGDRPLDFETVAGALGEDKALDWQEKRDAAKAGRDAVAGLEKMTPEQIEQRLDELKPEAGEGGFKQREDAYEIAVKQSNALLKLRAKDPARAAEDAFPDIAKLKEAKASQADIIAARMDAQAALGIPRAGRNPLTVIEAREQAKQIEFLEDDPEALTAHMEALAEGYFGTLGAYADEAFAQVLEQRSVGKEKAVELTNYMRSLSNAGDDMRANAYRAGDSFTVEDRRSWWQRLAGAGSRDQSEAAMNGQLPNAAARGQPRPAPQVEKPKGKASLAPSKKQIQMLRENPQLAPHFDKRFGEGMADQFLKVEDGAPVKKIQRAEDNAWILTYPGNWVETHYADGEWTGGEEAAPIRKVKK